MNPEEKSLVCLFSEPNFLALNIFENLLANNCFVNVVTTDPKQWLIKTSRIVTKNKFSILEERDLNKNLSHGYVIFCSGFLSKEKTAGDLKKFLTKINFRNTKTLFVLPKEVYGVINFNNSFFSDNFGVIYLGDLFGPRIDLDSDLKSPSYLTDILRVKKIAIPVGDLSYPLLVSDAAKQIVKWLFAFGPFGRETLLLGPEVSTDVFWRKALRNTSGVKFVSDGQGFSNKLPRNVDIFRINRDSNYCISETLTWISSNPRNPVLSKKDLFSKVRTKRPGGKSSRNKKTVTLLLLLIFTLPIFTSLIEGILSYVAYNSFRRGHDNVATTLFQINKLVSDVGYNESKVLRRIPLVGQVYKETEYISYASGDSSTVALVAMPLVRTGEKLFSNIFGDSLYSVTGLLSGSEESVQNIYTKLSLFEEKSIASKKDGSLIAGLVLSKINFDTYKNLMLQMVTVINKLPSALGEEDSQTYLVLFENNMELRPTGGFIGSYGLLTFDDGRLSDFTISDVYSADGQLNGHVEPPAPIKNYLGEANWWLRDSNWDPDFPTSAKRAEWFLDKEVDKSVDGVVAIDLDPVKEVLKIIGPILLTDYNLNITSENLYEKVQAEVQDNFFPGTHNKASFLTALSKSILNKVPDLSSFQKTSILKLAYQSLNGRHAQIFLHDSEIQKAINNLRWDGAVFVPTCERECFSDFVGIVEANVGVNKSNYFIKRNVGVSINVSSNNITDTIVLTLQNLANTDLGPSGRYKSYIRLLVPEEATDISAMTTFGQSIQNLIPDITAVRGRKEVGIIVEVLGGETKTITYSWNEKLDKPIDQYGFYFRKQAGVDDYPLSVSVILPAKLLASNPAFTLTNHGNYVYNTTLTQDLFARFSF